MINILGGAMKIMGLINSAFQLYKNSKEFIAGISAKETLDSTIPIKQVSTNLYKTSVQEMYNTQTLNTKTIDDDVIIKSNMQQLMSYDKKELVVSPAIILPEKFKAAFQRPEEILHGITEIQYFHDRMDLINDKTWKAITYSDNGKEFVGWVKTAWARDYLGVDYRPLVVLNYHDLARKLIMDFITKLDVKHFSQRPKNQIPSQYEQIINLFRPRGNDPDAFLSLIWHKNNWGILFLKSTMVLLGQTSVLIAYKYLNQYEFSIKQGRLLVVKDNLYTEVFDYRFESATQFNYLIDFFNALKSITRVANKNQHYYEEGGMQKMTVTY